MKRILSALFIICLVAGASNVFAQKTITIKGKVKFPYNRFNMEIVERQGFDKTILDSCKVKEDGTYEFKMKVDRPGVYTLDCQKWQSVNFWAEDEDLMIDFRGEDTAKMKIKNPPYVHINGGANNEVMNLLNWDGYRGYQLMIGVSQGVYRIPGIDDQAKQDVSGKFYTMLGDESRARVKFLAEHYGDRNSVLAVLSMLRGEENSELVKSVVSRLEAKNPNYAPLLKYKADLAEAKAQKERLAEGKVAPEFSFPTPDGKKSFGPQDFKGKILVLDFWASWCGPCRQEIPNLKKDYAEFSDKGVVFLSVSIDKDGADWRKAMKEENMPWTQVNAPKAGKDVMKQYQFSGIPYILVLDKEGRIVGKNLRGKKLTDKLTEMVSGKGKKSVAMPAMGM
ncbi:MAG: TlpA disulfide reductase family protein [Odoribacter sp.]